MRAPVLVQAAFVRAVTLGAAMSFAASAWAAASATEHLQAARAAEDANEPVRAANEADLVLVSADATYSQRETAKHVLANVGDQIALLIFQGDGTMSITVDDGSEERSPARYRLTPGVHDVVYRNLTTGAVVAEKVILPAADVIVVKGPAPPKAPNADAPKHAAPTYETQWHLPAVSWIAYGVGIVATGIAVGFGIATLNDESTVHAHPTQDNRDAFTRDRTVTFVSLGTAAVGAVAGTVIYLLAGSERVALYPTVTVGDWRIGL
ncbi:MAG: hypothetical protein ABI551_03660 [Polyangiaceae bacterium]